MIEESQKFDIETEIVHCTSPSLKATYGAKPEPKAKPQIKGLTDGDDDLLGNQYEIDEDNLYKSVLMRNFKLSLISVLSDEKNNPSKLSSSGRA